MPGVRFTGRAPLVAVVRRRAPACSEIYFRLFRSIRILFRFLGCTPYPNVGNRTRSARPPSPAQCPYARGGGVGGPLYLIILIRTRRYLCTRRIGNTAVGGFSSCDSVRVVGRAAAAVVLAAAVGIFSDNIYYCFTASGVANLFKH